MIITLNRDEVVGLVKKQLWRMGINISDTEGTDNITLHTEVGFINGDLALVVGVNEEIPEDLLDNEELHDASTDDNTNGQVAQDAGKPAKGGKRRKRRTRAEIEADEAAAKQAAEVKQPQQASGEAAGESQDAKQPEAETQKTEEILEAKAESDADQTKAVEEPVKETAVAEDNPFADLGSDNGSVETDPEPQVGTNPFPTEDADNLFETGSDQVHVDSPVETEQGFAKPKEDDDALNLFA